jgi:hypothetical protein
MAIIQLPVWGAFAPAPTVLLAIADSVSPRWTTCIEAAPASVLAALAPRAGVGAALAAPESGAGAAAAGFSALRAIAPSRTPEPVTGALTGALATADWPGVYTGGSSNMVYSRTRWPRAQLTSTSSVIKGSEIASVDLSLSIWRPSGVRTVRIWTPVR